MSIKTQIKHKREQQSRRQRRVRAIISGTTAKPRLCVYRSNKHIYAQLIDDQKGLTLAAVSDHQKNLYLKLNIEKNKLSTKQALAFQVGMAIAHQAQELKLNKLF